MKNLLPFLLLIACTDSPEAVDSGTTPLPTACPSIEGLSLSGEAIPGQTLAVDILGDPSEAELGWSVSSGEVQEDGREIGWTLDADLAIYEAEEANIQLLASQENCEEQLFSETIEVDHPEAHRLLLIYNPLVTDSETVAQHYAELRDVPDENFCGIETAADTTLAGDDLSAFAAALGACLDDIGPHMQILLPVYGVPYKVSGRIDDIVADDSVPTTSLDALLFLGPAADQASYAIYNPLYQDGSSMDGEYEPYQPIGTLLPDAEDTLGVPAFLVSRIDGVDAEAAMALVDRALSAEELAHSGALSGTVYVDGKAGDKEPTTDDFGTYESGEWNMWGTRSIFEDLAFYDVVWDGNSAEFGTAPAPTECPDALYYAGWYSYNNYNDAFTWAPGAIGGHLDSCSACDIRESTSWSANALQRGITATFGAVGEPYVAGMPEYDQFFLYLLQGASFAEAGFESTVVGLWMMAWLGDPLYRPYPGGVLD